MDVRTYCGTLHKPITCDNNAVVLSQYVVEDQEELITHRVIQPTALRQRTSLLCQVIATIYMYVCTYVCLMHYDIDIRTYLIATG